MVPLAMILMSLTTLASVIVCCVVCTRVIQLCADERQFVPIVPDGGGSGEAANAAQAVLDQVRAEAASRMPTGFTREANPEMFVDPFEHELAGEFPVPERREPRFPVHYGWSGGLPGVDGFVDEGSV